jgi:fructoselysine-6-P-deglycase FrlB-like protein
MDVPIESLVSAIRGALDLPLLAVGSGGSLTVADFAASLHREVAAATASAETPLEAVASGVELRRFAVMLATAGGGNPDVVGGFNRLASREPRRLVVLCMRTGSPLKTHAKRFPFVDFIEFDAPWGRDGFLATNSLVASAVLLTRAYSAASGTSIELPKKWESLIAGGSQSDIHKRVRAALGRDTLVVLHGAETRAAAIDVESKLTEAALRNVWTADFRHFAHGRHHWLAKRTNTSAVLAFITPTDQVLARRTLALIPRSVPVLREEIPFIGTVGALAALHAFCTSPVAQGPLSELIQGDQVFRPSVAVSID